MLTGQHISTLLLTLLFRFMRPLIENVRLCFWHNRRCTKLKWQRSDPEFAYSDRERDGLLERRAEGREEDQQGRRHSAATRV